MTKIIWCGGELALLGFTCVSACVKGENSKCANVGRLKLFFKLCGGSRIAIGIKTLHWFECRQTSQVCVELQLKCQPRFCRPKVYLEVKSLVVLLSV